MQVSDIFFILLLVSGLSILPLDIPSFGCINDLHCCGLDPVTNAF
jgi:hypothetical protein